MRREGACEQAQQGGEEEGALHWINPAWAGEGTVSGAFRDAGVHGVDQNRAGGAGSPGHWREKFSCSATSIPPSTPVQRACRRHHGIHISSYASFSNKLLTMVWAHVTQP
jgi:hypothetical protein